MRKTTIHTIILLLILFVSCKKETKTDEKTVVEKTELKTIQVDTLEKRNEKINKKKKPKREVPTDTLIVQKDTLFIESFDFSKMEKGIAKCKGKVNGIDIYFIAKTNDESEYLYCFGANPKRAVTYGKDRDQPHTVQKLTILLLKENKAVYELDFDLIFYKGYVVYMNNPKNLNLTEVEEMIELGYGAGFCGGVSGSIAFFRRGNKLIKGVLTNYFGEPGTDYFDQQIIVPKNNELNQIWVENKVGSTDFVNGKHQDIVYFKDIEKYELQQDSLIKLNPKKDNFHYVTARSGLRQRTGPFVKSDTLELLPFGTKVNVLNETDIKLDLYDDGKLINGRWVQIKYENEYKYVLSSYVFDGFLSKKKPTE